MSLVAALAGTLSAQSVVYFDDPALVAPPSVAFPFYTPGGGATGLPVRIQFLCPPTFAGLPGTAGLVTAIGMQIAGQAVYSRFELRAGINPNGLLTNDFARNLPDQRLQADRSGATLVGGGVPGTPANAWVEFPLAYPFHWQPGEALVVDLITQIAVVDSYCGTATGVTVPRAYNFAYAPGAMATSIQSTNGLRLSFRFEPVGIVGFGAGCAGTGGFVPAVGFSGSSRLGSIDGLITGSALLGGSLTALSLGWSTQSWAGGTLPFDLGGGCRLLVAPDAFVVGTAAGTGPGSGVAAVPLPIPVLPGLVGSVLHAQWLVQDPASAVGVAVSGGGSIVVLP